LYPRWTRRSAAIPVRSELRRADAGFRQNEMHRVGSLAVACKSGDDGAGLLVSRQHQESRCATVALDANRVESGLGVGQLPMAVRRHGAAGMQIRVDERPQDL